VEGGVTGQHDYTYELNMDAVRHSAYESKPIATVIVPIRTVSELNRHEHWRHRQKRARAQHDAVTVAMCVYCNHSRSCHFYRNGGQSLLPMHIHLTRLAPRKLDTDNLAGALKHCRDAVAKFLGVDDGDEAKVTWSVGQEPAKGYSVRVEFYRRTG
jgi:hypothetical protein